ncbi:MAG: hypothetical protein FWG30_11180 [Eubacteriaceae bacterium]|nr:hypothetical protein [Eubacteriaceae bacterium]
MNIIRSRAVELTTIPAIAYKQKLKSGGAGLKLIHLELEKSAVAEIDKGTGEPVLDSRVDEKIFPYEAFEEARELVVGMPFSARGKIKLEVEATAEEDDVSDEEEDAIEMYNSDEYIAILDRYIDEKGRLNYALINKDFIQFASKSKTVSKMVAEGEKVDDIIVFVVKSRAALIAGKKDSLSDEETKALISTLNEIDPRSAFSELKAHLNRLLSRAKRR